MKKLNLLKTLILVIAVLTSTVEAFATATEVRSLTVTALEAVTITKTSGTAETGIVNPENGHHSGWNPTFTLEVTDPTTTDLFVIGSKIVSEGNVEVSAFSNDGKALLFGRFEEEEYLPTLEAIENAKDGGSNNANVIAYPFNITISSPMTIEFNPTLEAENGITGCYVISLNDSMSANIEETIGGTPHGKTYNAGQDMSGSYRAVVFFTAIKP